jgi:hypothetical protein
LLIVDWVLLDSTAAREKLPVAATLRNSFKVSMSIAMASLRYSTGE